MLLSRLINMSVRAAVPFVRQSLWASSLLVASLHLQDFRMRTLYVKHPCCWSLLVVAEEFVGLKVWPQRWCRATVVLAEQGRRPGCHIYQVIVRVKHGKCEISTAQVCLLKSPQEWFQFNQSESSILMQLASKKDIYWWSNWSIFRDVKAWKSSLSLRPELRHFLFIYSIRASDWELTQIFVSFLPQSFRQNFPLARPRGHEYLLRIPHGCFLFGNPQSVSWTEEKLPLMHILYVNMLTRYSHATMSEGQNHEFYFCVAVSAK